MHKIELINFNNINVNEPLLPFAQNGMHFLGIRYPSRQLQLYLHGHVAEAPAQSPEEYGGEHYFYFQPDSTDVPNLAKLEELLQGDQSGRLLEGLDLDLSKYEFRETLNDNHQLRIKLKQDENGWKFTSNSKLTVDSLEADLKKGTPVTLTVAPGFYFSDDNEKYGLYLTLKELKFDDAAELPMRGKAKSILKRPLKKTN